VTDYFLSYSCIRALNSGRQRPMDMDVMTNVTQATLGRMWPGAGESNF